MKHLIVNCFSQSAEEPAFGPGQPRQCCAAQLMSTSHRFVPHQLETCANCILAQNRYCSWLLHSILTRPSAFTSYMAQQIKNKSYFSYAYTGVVVTGMMFCDAFHIANRKNLKSAISTNLSVNHMQLSVLHIARIS